MKLSWSSLVVVIFAIGMNSCFEAPTYPTTPEIEYKNVQFVDVTTPSSFDSLILTLRFKDGDGDLGLDATETDWASKGVTYADKFYLWRATLDTVFQQDGYYVVYRNGELVRDNVGRIVTLNRTDLVSYKDKRTNPSFTYLPGFTSPYSCTNWEVAKDNNNVVKDTLYFSLNPNHYNIFVDFLVKQNNGSFKEFDWRTEFVYPACGIPFDGRFPILSKDLEKKSPLEGEIRYAMTSVGFLSLFSTKTLKLSVGIQDRALHKSNVVETPEFRLK